MVVAKWRSMYYHVTNRHENLPIDMFPTCSHGELDEERIWLDEGYRNINYNEHLQYCVCSFVVRTNLKVVNFRKLRSRETEGNRVQYITHF